MGNISIDNKAVESQEMLYTRNTQALRRQKMLKRHRQPLVCLTLNITDPVQCLPMTERTFNEGCTAMQAHLTAGRIRTTSHEPYMEKTVCEAYYSVAASADVVKRIMVALEDTHPLLCLFNIDVLRPDGTKVHRSEIGCAPRKCFLCKLPEDQCAHNRICQKEQFQQYAREIIVEYFSEEFSETISKLALRALLYEVSVTPKPGLVDRISSGAHKDMDFFSFIDSSCSLIPYFKTCTRMGLKHSDLACEEFLALLRPEGILAEKQMFTATKGVNTHKGAIFSLGLLCAAAGRIAARGTGLEAETLCREAQNLAQCTLGDYLHMDTSANLTGGEAAYVRYGLTGVRGEAASGFFHVRKISLPALRHQLGQGSTLNDAGVVALLHLMGKIEDSYVIKRRGKEALEDLHRHVNDLLQKGTLTMDGVKALDRFLIEQNISPGGCADLLAITFFLQFISTAPNLNL
ncbi:MAG: triphosphoribosyl-dephospho-CoA synthase CitG [Clostridiales bacterium]|nr:triphosphoribosyl-dephospho-CoA synthase CitG [Clostridiales bacterium]